MPFTVDAVPIYAGDTTQFPSYTFSTDGVQSDFVTEGWSGWVATWRKYHRSAEMILLAVDSSEANLGIIIVSATAAQTREMNGPGVWDLQATRDVSEVRTFVTGITEYSVDVTQ